MSDVLFETDIKELPLLFRGKVRDIYDLGDALLVVTSDRLSAFDVVLPTPIPDKGRVLTALSTFWFERTRHIVANHLLDRRLEDVVPAAWVDRLRDRAQIVHKAKPLPVEAVVRGYLAGSGWEEYKRSSTVCGAPLPPGLRQADKLPKPIFTPSTKAPQGEHDQNISFAEAERLLGADLAGQVRDLSLAVYRFGADWAEQRGIIIADTKFEFGLLDGKIILIDEVMTPDSSRFWPQSEYRPGSSPPSFDKQYVRDYLTAIGWKKEPPGPELPADVVRKTSEKYREALKRLTT
ncbi:MAG TPA: phosphoribosylaminoimidazolesuccinocarboxamide synthase [Candidatus Dormibacteraeota bacterium]|nr:phosphoribosylaminoimidazolesuccinocarboxamide synthase [Candidatus Dormibacteraeota bacterium]